MFGVYKKHHLIHFFLNEVIYIYFIFQLNISLV